MCDLKINCSNIVKWTASIAQHDLYRTQRRGHLRLDEKREEEEGRWWERMPEEYVSASS